MASTKNLSTSEIIGYLQLAAQLIEAGKTSVAALRGWLVQEGATPEQLADMDARLSSAIAAREAERSTEGPIEG